MNNLDLIIEGVVNEYIDKNSFDESKKNTHEKESGQKNNADLDTVPKHNKKKHKFRAKAIKKKGGYRTDFDEKEDSTYNKEVGEDEQGSIQDFLDNGFINVKQVATKLYPNLTPNGAQSELRKKLKGEHADSGYKYHLKSKEMRALRHIISQYLSNN